MQINIPKSRATILRERRFVESAIGEVVGAQEAKRLMELGDELRQSEHEPEQPLSATMRAEALMETREGRAKLAKLTWKDV